MAKGCLLLLGLLSGALVVERAVVEGRGLPAPWLAATVLAASLTLAVGSVWGIVRVLRQRRLPQTGRDGWTDGAVVRTGGQVEPVGPLLRSPLGGREALVVEYSVSRTPSWARIGGSPQARPTPPLACGLEAVPFRLRTASDTVAIEGCPSLNHFPEVDCGDSDGRARAARLLAAHTWRVSTVDEVWRAARELLDGQEAALPLRLANPACVRALLAPAGEPSAGRWSESPPPDLEGEAAAAAIHSRLCRHPWQLKERVLAPGADVTLVGIYRVSPPRIEVGSRLFGPDPDYGMRPGLPSANASRDAGTAAMFAAVLVGLAAAAHWAVYASGGSLYRAFLDWLRQAG